MWDPEAFKYTDLLDIDFLSQIFAAIKDYLWGILTSDMLRSGQPGVAIESEVQGPGTEHELSWGEWEAEDKIGYKGKTCSEPPSGISKLPRQRKKRKLPFVEEDCC